MDEEKRARVDSLLEEALSRTGLERAAFLAETLREDEEVGREVSSLLGCHEQAGSFLETPPLGACRAESYAPAFASGEVLSGRFQIVEMRDRGGMGEVYEALDLELRERVALKTIRPELAWDERVVERFRREAHLARKVTHRNVCRVYDVFHVSREGSEDFLFLTMELLPGENLASYRERRERIDWREALPILMQILFGLEAAYSVGVLHRDLKAENVMLIPEAEGARVVVTDFGLAALVDSESGARGLEFGASSRSALGTPAYMSPEQLRREAVDHRSDVFSFGVIAYEMLSGENPYPLASERQPLWKRFESRPRSLREFGRRIPRALDRLVLQSLEVEPSARPRDASEIRQKLSAIPIEIPARRKVLLASASALGGAYVLVKTGPLVWDLFERWAFGPRVLPLEDYVDSSKALEALRAGIGNVRDGANLIAISYFEQAIAEDANSILARIELVEVLLNVGERNQASEVLARISDVEGVRPRNATESRLLRSVRARCNEDYNSSWEEFGVVKDYYRDDVHLLLHYARRLEESGNFVAVLPCYEAIAGQAYAAFLGLGRTLTTTGDPARAIELLSNQTPSRPWSDEALGMRHSVLGMAHYDRGAFKDAIRHWELSLDHRVNAGDRRGESASLANLANAYGRVGKFETVSALLDRALQLSREMGDRDYESYVIGRIGWRHLVGGNPSAALSLFRDALAMESARKDHGLLAARLNAMAHANVFVGFLADAQMNLAEAAKHIGPSGQKDQLAYNYSLNGMIAAAQGRYEESDDAFHRAIGVFRKAMMPHEVAAVHLFLAESLSFRGDYGIGEHMLREASGAFGALEDELGLARTEVYEAMLAFAQGALGDAHSALAMAEGHLKGSRYWDTGVRALLVRGDLCMAHSKIESAIREFGLAAETSVQSGFKGLGVLAQLKLGRALASSGQFRDARMPIDQAIEISERLGLHPLEAMATLALSSLYLMAGDLESAVRASADAIGAAKSMSLKPIVFRGCVVLGDALFSMGRSRNAAAAYREAYEVHRSILAKLPASRRDVYQNTPDIRTSLERISARQVS